MIATLFHETTWVEFYRGSVFMAAVAATVIVMCWTVTIRANAGRKKQAIPVPALFWYLLAATISLWLVAVVGLVLIPGPQL